MHFKIEPIYFGKGKNVMMYYERGGVAIKISPLGDSALHNCFNLSTLA